VIILDSGVLIAAINRNDEYHACCAAFLDQVEEPLVLPAMVITEVAYMLARPFHGSPKLAAIFLDSLADEGLTIEGPTRADLSRTAALVRQYANLPLDAPDANVIATAERLNITKVATVDRRDFGIVVPAHGPLELLPIDLPVRN
jgi:uncharacterized protein